MSTMPGDPDDLSHEMSRQREIERERALERVLAGDPPWEHETGIMAAVEAVRDLRFPMTSAELSECAGERYIQASDRLAVPVAEVLAHLPERDFESIRDFERAVQKHWQGIRFLEVPDEQRPPEGGFQPTQRPGWPHHAGRAAQGKRRAKDE